MTGTPQDDQLDAAIAHVGQVAEQVREGLGFGSSEGDPAGGPVKVLVDLWRERISQGKYRTCAHLTSPQPTFGMLPLLGDLVCAKCVGKQRERYFAKIPHDRCDACGQVPPNGRFTEITLYGGVGVISANICRSCVDLASIPGATPPAADIGERLAAAEAVMMTAGQCSYCNSTSTTAPHPLLKKLTVTTIHHDSWCPVLAERG